MSADETLSPIVISSNGGVRIDASGVADFLYAEARLLDEHDYDGWLELWDEDGLYWIPADGEPVDPATHVSFVCDNRRRLETRVKQLQTGYRWAQLPQSRTQHYVTNVEARDLGADRVEARCAYLVIEARFGEMQFWPGRAIHELVRSESSGFRIRRKTFILINNDQPVTSMAFLP